MAKLSISRPMSIDVNFGVEASGSSVFVTANGSKIVEFTKDGYMRRLKGTPAVGLRRLPDSRVAIKPKKTR